jgi:hypothetical protein
MTRYSRELCAGLICLWSTTMKDNRRKKTYRSPSYNIRAPWFTDVRRILSSGCSGTTLHSKNRKLVRGFSWLDWNLIGFLDRSQGNDSRPEYLNRPTSHAIALFFRASRSSSSSVCKGRINSCETPPGACTMQPRTVRMPVLQGFPERIIRWKELAGSTTLVGCDWKSTPEVLQELTQNTNQSN